jgi:hypothetical protein
MGTTSIHSPAVDFFMLYAVAMCIFIIWDFMRSSRAAGDGAGTKSNKSAQDEPRDPSRTK